MRLLPNATRLISLHVRVRNRSNARPTMNFVLLYRFFELAYTIIAIELLELANRYWREAWDKKPYMSLDILDYLIIKAGITYEVFLNNLKYLA